MLRVCVWALAPNRHVLPMINSLHARGSLSHVFYEGRHFSWTEYGVPVRQAGTLASPGDVPHTFIQGDALKLSSVRKTLRDVDADVHLVLGLVGRLCQSALVAARREARPYFLFAESLWPRSLLDPKRVLRTAAYWYLLRKAAGVFALSRRAAESFVSTGVPLSKILPAIYAGPAPITRLNSTCGRRLLFCGRLTEQKGPDLLCRALVHLSRRVSDVKCEFIGDGPLYSVIRSMAAAPLCDFRGALETTSVLESMARASVLVVPSRIRDGWGYVVNEAIAAGLPVVVSEVVAASELVVPGRTGLVFREDDPTDLAVALERCLQLAQMPEQCEPAISAICKAMGSGPFVEYLLAATQSVMRCEAPPEAPWLRCVEDLGGNDASLWWRTRTQYGAARGLTG
jgi:glycosyltransferase involved in cell wall biosynthesis